MTTYYLLLYYYYSITSSITITLLLLLLPQTLLARSYISIVGEVNLMNNNVTTWGNYF